MPMADPQAIEQLYAFMQARRHAVIATASPGGTPEAALIEIAVTPELEVIFETTTATRKIANLRANPRVSLVIGWQDDRTLQYDGLVDEPSGNSLERIRAHYISTFPQKASHQSWPGNLYFRVRPVWTRLSDYNSPRTIVEHQFDQPASAPPDRHPRWWHPLLPHLRNRDRDSLDD
jgi:hypothetical protein